MSRNWEAVILWGPLEEGSELAWTFGFIGRDLGGRGCGARAVTPGYYMRCLG